MNYGLVAGVDKPVSRLIQGTLGVSGASLAESFALFDAVYEAGCTAFDTAPVYGHGQAERALGQWLAARGIADRVVVFAKGVHPEGARPRINAKELRYDIDGTLQRLGLRHIDLFMLHRDDPAMPVGEIIDLLDEQRRLGKIGAYGASNWSHARLREAAEYAQRRGVPPFAASSPSFSLAVPERSWPGCVDISGAAGAAARDEYQRNGLPVLAWSPLGSGFLTGRYSRNDVGTATDRGDQRVLSFYASDENFARLERLAAAAEQRGVTLSQAAIAYLLSQPLNLYAVVGCRDGAEFRSLWQPALRFTAAELQALESPSRLPAFL